MKPAEPLTLFVDPEEPCEACKGTGRRPDHDDRRCWSCGGTGLKASRPNPDTAEIPY